MKKDARESHIKALGRLAARLRKAVRLDQVMAIRQQAEAIRLQAKLQRSEQAIINDATKLRLQAEQRGGEMLAAKSLRGGDRQSKGPERRPTLADLGVDPNESTRLQRVAAVPEAVFEMYIATEKANGERISSDGLLRFHEAHARSTTRTGTDPRPRDLRKADEN